MRKKLILLVMLIGSTANAQQLYFPPLIGNTWETATPSSLGWRADKIDTLYQFLEQENSKAFLVLKDGKIVLEKYFGTFTADSLWYWASAGKTITAFLIGQAQEDGYLSINDTSSKYLGLGWTSCTPTQEGLIKIRNQLTMTSGLDDGVPDNHCTDDTCLKFKAIAGTRWAYHNAPYTLLEKVLIAATGQPINTYTQNKLKSRTGMTGFWGTLDYDNVYFSRARSMARFGLLIQNRGVWSTDTLLRDQTYFNQMINTSQFLNLSYGYLWWLNGKASFMAPTLQTVFPGSYAPHAPTDMIAGLGKNGQIVSISKSKGLVFVRMGDLPDDFGEVPILFCDAIWQKLNDVMSTSSIQEADLKLPTSNRLNQNYPNPFNPETVIGYQLAVSGEVKLEVFDILGRKVATLVNERNSAGSYDAKFNASGLTSGVYFYKLDVRSAGSLVGSFSQTRKMLLVK